MRACAAAVQARLAEGSITAVAASPDGGSLVAAATDGSLSLLESRVPGACLAKLACDSALLCCRCDGDTVLAGAQSGQVSRTARHARLQAFQAQLGRLLQQEDGGRVAQQAALW